MFNTLVLRPVYRRYSHFAFFVAGLFLSLFIGIHIILADDLSTWQPGSNLPDVRIELSMVSYGSHLIVLGGSSASTVYKDVSTATIAANGTLGTWASTTPLPTELTSLTSVISKGHLFVIGGYHRPFDPGGGQSTVFSALLSSNGTVGAWSSVTPLPTDLYRSAAVSYNQWIYVIGGFSDQYSTMQSLVLRAEVQSNGTLSAWTSVTPLPVALHGHSAVVVGKRIFVIGGLTGTGSGNTNIVRTTTINPDGSLNGWTTSTALPSALAVMRAVVIQDRIIIAGGAQGASANQDSASVYIGKVDANGSILQWEVAESLPAPTSYFGLAAYKNIVFAAGGSSNSTPLNTVYATGLTMSPFGVDPPIVDRFQWPYQWPLIRPVPPTRYPLYGDPNTQCDGFGVHHALDLVDLQEANPAILAVADGIVETVGVDIGSKDGKPTGYGYYVVIWHKIDPDHYIYSLYAHLLPNSVQVEKGQLVHRGDLIGRQDTSGGAGGVNHLHFELRNKRRPTINCPETVEIANGDWYDPANFISDHWWDRASYADTASAVTASVATEIQNTEATINPDEQSGIFNVVVDAFKKLLSFAIDFQGSSLEVTIYRPGGAIYGTYVVDNPPALITIPDADAGTWGYSIRAIEVPFTNYPYAVSVGTSDLALEDIAEQDSPNEPVGDITPPTTTLLLNGQNPTAIYNQPVEVSLTATDNAGGEGVTLTLYSLDGGATYLIYTDPFIFDLEGTNTISFYSQDQAGNIETTKTSSITIDTTPPAVPTLLNPPDQAQLLGKQITFQWGASLDAVRYEMRLGHGNPPSGIVTSTTTTRYVSPYALVAGIYYWQVRAFDAVGNGSDWSAPYRVTALSEGDAVPARNYYATSTPILSWSRVAWAVTYQIQVDDTLNFSSQLDFSATIPGSQLAAPVGPLPNGVYYWRIRACPAAGACGLWSTADSFIVDG